MEETEDQHRRLGIGRYAEPGLEPVQIIDRLVDDRQADDRVDDVGVGANVEDDAEQQRGAVADREQRHIGTDVLQPIEEEDDPGQEQQMVVAGDHVLGPQIHIGDDVDA